jgi:hypothetical protein
MLRTILEWVLERPMMVVVLLVFIAQIIRGLMNARKAGAEHETQRDEVAEARRVREIQEQIRRQIAERRGSGQPVEIPPARPEMEPPPLARPETTQMPQPLGGPLARMLEELQKRAQPAPSAPPVMLEPQRNAELERQQKLADELRSLEETRVRLQRRAASLAADKGAMAQTGPEERVAGRDRLLGDLRDFQGLRRAFLTREILGPPVGLR